MTPIEITIRGQVYKLIDNAENGLIWEGRCIVCQAAFSLVTPRRCRLDVITCREHRGTVRRAQRGRLLVAKRQTSRRQISATLSEGELQTAADALATMLSNGPRNLTELATELAESGGTTRQAEAAIYRLLRERWGTFVSTATDDGDALVRLGRPAAKVRR